MFYEIKCCHTGDTFAYFIPSFNRAIFCHTWGVSFLSSIAGITNCKPVGACQWELAVRTRPVGACKLCIRSQWELASFVLGGHSDASWHLEKCPVEWELASVHFNIYIYIYLMMTHRWFFCFLHWHFDQTLFYNNRGVIFLWSNARQTDEWVTTYAKDSSKMIK
jgi:hypothetical protein